MKHAFTLLVYLIISKAIAQEKPDFKQLAGAIDSIAINQKWKADIPGFAVGVIVDNQIIFEKTYGVQSLSSPDPLTGQSDFHMASVSKPFAATAILQLVESGKLNLDSTVGYYLPYFRMRDERYKKVTLYHILTHSSGIPDVTDYEWDRPQADDGAAERYTRTFTQLDLDFASGSKFNYSNAAFDILADVISKASGISFEHYMTKNIFIPIGMHHSSFLLSDISVNRRTSPHIINDSLSQIASQVYPYNRIHAPSSTLHSNLTDMLKWAQVYLNKGSINGHEVIKKTTWETMIRPRLKVDSQYTVCLSWFEVQVGLKTIYFHSGGDLGYRSFVGFDPEDNVAVVLMGNNELFDAVEPAIAIFKKIILNHSPTLTPQPIHLHLKDYVLKSGVAKVKEIYFQKKREEPNQYDYRANSLVILAGWLYDRGYTQHAIDMMIFCTEVEPKVSLWCEYLGDVYSAEGDKENAMLWLKKALLLDPTKKEIEMKITAIGL